MSQQNPSPRKAVVAFGVPMSQTIINALGALSMADGSAWDAEDAIYAYRDHAQADRDPWYDLEHTLSNRLDAEEALALAEGLAAGVEQGQPANPSPGTEDQVLDCWGVHAMTHSTRRERVRALSRLVASRQSPSAVLAALTAAVVALPQVVVQS